MIQADDRLKAIFDEAVKIAKSHSHEYVTLEHLLFVLLLQPEVDDLLQSNKDIKVDALMNDLQNHIENELNEIKVQAEDFPKRTQAVERTVNRAFTTAIFSGKEYVDAFQLIISIYGEKNAHAVFFLNKHGLTKKIVVDYLVEVGSDVPDETAVNPFDFWEGADFKLKLRKVDGYWNYDKSEFAEPSALFDNDEEIEALWKTEYSLADFTAASNFKSYDELKTRLDAVLAGTVTVGKAEDIMEDAPVAEPKVDTAPAPQPTVSDDDEDDAMSYFEKLANE